MRAVICHQGTLAVADLATPIPAKGQLLVEVQRCGVCGSDLHARVHGDELGKVMVETGYDDFMRSDQEIVLGHELYGVVADQHRYFPALSSSAYAWPTARSSSIHASTGARCRPDDQGALDRLVGV